MEEPLEETIGRLLRESGKTIATAESTTGGYVGHLLNSPPGSSKYYIGSVVAYHTRPKKTLLNVPDEVFADVGSVSAQAVLAMARNVRELMDTDIGVSESGIAGPTGGNADRPWERSSSPSRPATATSSPSATSSTRVAPSSSSAPPRPSSTSSATTSPEASLPLGRTKGGTRRPLAKPPSRWEGLRAGTRRPLAKPPSRWEGLRAGTRRPSLPAGEGLDEGARSRPPTCSRSRPRRAPPSAPSATRAACSALR